MARTRVAVKDGALDLKDFLGRAATYTLPDDPRKGSTLARTWDKHGLDLDYLPDARQPVHIFQSACASVNSRASNGHGEKIEIRADEVFNNGTCVYQITVKVWDRANKVIEHEKALRATFDKQASTISFDHFGYTDVRLKEVEERIRDHFDANAKTVPGQKIRNAIRDTLLGAGALNLRRKAGGLYFVPDTYKPNGDEQPTLPILKGLVRVLKDLYGERADFYFWPLPNDEDMQEMVRKHFVINANARAEELAAKAWARAQAGRGQRGVRLDLLTNLHNERRKLLHAADQFRALVGAEQKDLDTNLNDLEDAIVALEDLRDENKES